MIEYTCTICGKKFLGYKTPKRQTCSIECRTIKVNSFNKGRKHSKEHSKKISIALKGRISPMLGKKHSKNTIKKMRIVSNSGWFPKGKKHWNWGNGKFRHEGYIHIKTYNHPIHK